VTFCTAFMCFLLLGWTPVYAQTGAQPAHQQQTQTATNSAKIDPAKEADIRKLMELSGAQLLAGQMMDRMSEGIKPLLANSFPPGEYREKLIDLFFAKFRSKADPKQLLDMAVPIYDKYFSHEEVKALIQFYQTPLGQKTITALPKLTAELSDAGRQWGQQLGAESMQEVLAEHPDLAKALEEAGKTKP
jgi:hypothetical protein